MSRFTLIKSGVDVRALLSEIDAHPEIWNERPERRAGASPHRETSDVWVRYADSGWLAKNRDFMGPHKSVWWPVTRHIPAVFGVVDEVEEALGGDRLALGGILLTRINPGKQVYPHHDRGTWHAEFYTTKVWLPLRANDQCVNSVEDESMVWKPGEAWSHDNLLVHAVENGGDTERICFIMCFRRV